MDRFLRASLPLVVCWTAWSCGPSGAGTVAPDVAVPGVAVQDVAAVDDDVTEAAPADAQAVTPAAVVVQSEAAHSESLRVSAEGPLSAAQRAVLHGSPQDESPARRNGIMGMHEEEHYISGNERTLDLYHPHIADVGGGYVGVGTDQGYLLVDWARSDVAWFIDYDAEVQVVHEIYRRFFLGAATPEEFLALWHVDGRAAAKALLVADAEPARAKQLTEAYATYRAEIGKRLGKVAGRMTKVGIPCYLTELARYERMREMLEEGRIRPMLANLLDDEALAGIADSARTLEVPIRLIYLSNAEQYWRRYDSQFRTNIAALPLHDDALLLRTLLRGSIDKDFHYGVQPATNYVQWLQAPYVRNVYDMTGRPEAEKGTRSFFRTEGDPEKTSLARRWRAAQGASQ